MLKQDIPETIDQAVDYLNKKISLEDRIYLSTLKENELIRLHHSLGRFIRNNFNLWKGGKLLKETGKIHPDDGSMVILKKFWESLLKNQ